jgi:hypothetical protein
MAASLVHIAAGFSVVEDPLLPGNILLTLVHRDTPFLFTQNFRSIQGGRIYLQSKQLLVRDDDVQVLHGFNTVKDAEGYLTNKLITDDVVVALKPLLLDPSEVWIYEAQYRFSKLPRDDKLGQRHLLTPLGAWPARYFVPDSLRNYFKFAVPSRGFGFKAMVSGAGRL